MFFVDFLINYESGIIFLKWIKIKIGDFINYFCRELLINSTMFRPRFLDKFLILWELFWSELHLRNVILRKWICLVILFCKKEKQRR